MAKILTPVHYAARVIVGHCAACHEPIVVLNNYETWPLIECHCGWTGGVWDLNNPHAFTNNNVDVLLEDNQ